MAGTVNIVHAGPRDAPWRSAGDAGTADEPEARPGPPFTDLLGRQPVRIVAEGHDLAAYGFGHQRIAIPGASVSRVMLTRAPAVVFLDHDEHMLLKAAGSWNPYGLTAVCGRAGAPRPALPPARTRTRTRTRSSRSRKQPVPRWPKAAGYRRLRVRPRGFAAGMTALVLAAIAFACLGAFAGSLPAVALPGSTGTVRNLIGIAGALIGLTLALWLFGICVRTGLAAVRWSAASRQMQSPAPWAPFYPRSAKRGRARMLLTIGMVLAVPALIGWGPGIGIVTLVHGFSDQALVTHLRAVGVRAPGQVVGVPQYSTDSDGNTTVTYQANLEFTAGSQGVLTPDPAIGGRIWPIGDLVTVVYDPAQPQTAVAQGQLHGPPWGGAPLGNLISGALLTLLLPVLVWRLILRISRLRRAAREDMLEGLW